jgi:hypothetical protein
MSKKAAISIAFLIEGITAVNLVLLIQVDFTDQTVD